MNNFTDQFYTRLLAMKDLDGYFNLIERNRPYLEEYFPVTVSLSGTLENTRTYIETNLQKIERKEFYPFLIIDTSTEMPIGSVFVKSIDWNIPKAEIGYFIDHQSGGKGIVTNAVANVIRYCFEILALRKLLIKTHESNIGSRRVAEKNGFRIEGTIRSDHKTTDGRILDMLYYGLTRDDKL